MGPPTSSPGQHPFSTGARGILAQTILYKSAKLFQNAVVCTLKCNVWTDWRVHINGTGWVKCVLGLLHTSVSVL